MMIFSLLIASTFAAVPTRLDLQQALDHALVHNQELQAEQTTVEAAKADIALATASFGPKLEALAGVGPNYRATGDALNGERDRSVWGHTFLADISITQPLYSFGRKDNYASAATAGRQVKSFGVAAKAQDLRLNVKEAYYGYLLAKSLWDFLQESKTDVKRATDEKRNFSKKDHYRLELFFAQVDVHEADLKSKLKLAEQGLQLRLGAGTEEFFLPKEEWLDTQERAKQSLEYYLGLAQSSRQEFGQIEQGILAKRALARGEMGAFLPVLAGLARYEYANTNVRSEQKSPFAYDPFNKSEWVVGLGLKWDLTWGVPQAKAGKLAAEAEELEAKQGFAVRGVETELKRAYWELEAAEAKLTAAASANKTSKKWLSGELLALGSGLGNGHLEDLAQAYVARVEAVKNYYSAIHEQHMSWARLSRAVGSEVDPALQR